MSEIIRVTDSTTTVNAVESGTIEVAVTTSPMTVTLAGERGIQGPPGPAGPPGDADDLPADLLDPPDLILLFENGLI
jgi:hypothetical protein